MLHQRHLFCLFVGVLALFLSIHGSHAEDKESKNDMEHIFPLLFMLGGAPTVHSPAIWIMSAVSLGAILFVGKGYIKLKAE